MYGYLEELQWVHKNKHAEEPTVCECELRGGESACQAFAILSQKSSRRVILWKHQPTFLLWWVNSYRLEKPGFIVI